MMDMRVRAARRVAGYPLAAVLTALTVAAHGQASDSQPAARPLEVPAVTLSIEDVAEAQVEPGLPPEAELTKPDLAVPLPEADELRVVTPGLPEVLTDSGEGGTGLLGPDLALQAAVATGNNGLLRSSIALQHAGDGPDFHLGVDHQLLEGFGRNAPDQAYHRTDDLQGAYSSDIGGAEIGVAARYRRVEDGLQGLSDARHGHELSDQLVDGNLTLLAQPSDAVAVSGSIGGRSASRAFRGSDTQAVTEWQGRAAAGFTAQLRQLEIGLDGDYEFRHVRAEEDTEHRLLGQLALAYDLAAVRFGARAGVRYAPKADPEELRIPFEVFVDGAPSDLITLRVVAGREIIGRDLSSLYETLKFIEEPSELRDTRRWFGDASVRAAVGGAVQVVASMRGELGADRVDIDGDRRASGLHQVVQKEAHTLQTGLGLRWDINPTAALNLDWSGTFFDVPLYQAPHVLSVGMRATWDGGRFGIENNVDWVFPSALDRLHQARDVGLPNISASGFYNVSDHFAVVAGFADLLQPLSDEPRYELAPYEEPGFQASLGVEVNL